LVILVVAEENCEEIFPLLEKIATNFHKLRLFFMR